MKTMEWISESFILAALHRYAFGLSEWLSHIFNQHIYIFNLGSIWGACWHERCLKEWKFCILHVYMWTSLISVTHTCEHTSAGWFLLRWRSERRCHCSNFNRGWLTEGKWRTGDHLDGMRWARNPALHSCILCLSSALRRPSQSPHGVRTVLFILNCPPLLVQLLF